MLGFLLADFNAPFLWSFVLLTMFAVTELILVFVGGGVSQYLDSLLGDVDVDLDLPEAVSTIFSFCHIGSLPFLVVLTLFLTFFSVFGFALQWGIQQVFGQTWGFLLPLIVVVPATLFALHLVGKRLVRLLSLDKRQVASSEEFVGKLAIVTLGKGGFDQPTQAKLLDDVGRNQYIMVKSFEQDQVLEPKSTILIVEKSSAFFRAIPAPDDLQINL